MVESPGAMIVMEGVVVPAHELDRPAGVTQNHEDEIADGSGPGVVPIGDDRVEDEVTLGSVRLPLRVSAAERVVTLMRAHARHLADTVGAVGGDDVIGPAVVEGLGVHGDGGAHALGNLGMGHLGGHVVSPDVSSRFRVTIGVHAQKPMSAMGLTRGFTLTECSAGSSLS